MADNGFDMTQYEYELDKIICAVLPHDHEAHERKRRLAAEAGE